MGSSLISNSKCGWETFPSQCVFQVEPDPRTITTLEARCSSMRIRIRGGRFGFARGQGDGDCDEAGYDSGHNPMCSHSVARPPALLGHELRIAKAGSQVVVHQAHGLHEG